MESDFGFYDLVPYLLILGIVATIIVILKYAAGWRTDTKKEKEQLQRIMLNVVKSIGVIAYTLMFTAIALYLMCGKAEKTIITITAFLILSELAIIWNPQKTTGHKVSINSACQENKKVSVSRWLGRLIGKMLKPQKHKN